MIYTTLNKIRAYEPCLDGWAKLLRHLNKTQADDEPLALATILDSNGLDDALWCLRAIDGYDREKRLFAVWCARRVQHLMRHPRSIAAIDVAERHANGQATDAELTAAMDAAWDAARAEWAAAGEAAWDAARAEWAAAWDAAWAAAWAAWAAGAAERAAAGNAAREAAVDAARAATGEAAGAAWAAWEAERAEQEAEFRRVLCDALRREGDQTWL